MAPFKFRAGREAAGTGAMRRLSAVEECVSLRGMIRITDLLRQGARQLAGDEARHEAEHLLMHTLGRDRAWLFAHGDEAPDAAAAARFQVLLARRVAGEPVAYLTGRRGFWTLELEVTPATLIPRPETELLIELALARLGDRRKAWRIADLGTGSGVIALSLASELPMAEILATDISAEALEVAARNACTNGIGNVRFLRGDWLSPLHGQRFDLIVSNPPYIAEGDPHLQCGDLRYEPALALSCGRDGLEAIRAITAAAPLHLDPGGGLMFEHGCDQGAAVRALMCAAGFTDVASARDLEQRERATSGRWPG